MNNAHNNFNDIQHTPLRVFNRTILFNNIFSNFGSMSAEEYLDQFNQGEKKQMFIMQTFIKKFGYKEAKKSACKGLELSPENFNEPVGA